MDAKLRRKTITKNEGYCKRYDSQGTKQIERRNNKTQGKD